MEALITFVIVLIAIFAAFKLFGWSIKIFIKLLINALIGAAIIFIFNYVFAGLLNLKAFEIELNWISALITGVLGVPGVIVMLVLGFIL